MDGEELKGPEADKIRGSLGGLLARSKNGGLTNRLPPTFSRGKESRARQGAEEFSGNSGTSGRSQSKRLGRRKDGRGRATQAAQGPRGWLDPWESRKAEQAEGTGGRGSRAWVERMRSRKRERPGGGKNPSRSNGRARWEQSGQRKRQRMFWV